MQNSLKNKIRTKLWPLKLALIDLRLSMRMKIFAVKSRSRRIQRQKQKGLLTDSSKPVYHFAILCIKKLKYADLAINHVNSLHYINPAHKFTLYCDALSARYLNRKKNRFDYPDQVTIDIMVDDATKAWQYYKIDVHIEAAKRGQIDTDADGVWHEEPVIDMDKIMMLTFMKRIEETPNEKALVEKVFNKPEWGSFTHRVAAFVHIPSRFMTDKLAADMRRINDTIFTHHLDFIQSEKARGEMRRLSEELGVNLSLQSNYPNEKIIVLKEEDGPNSRKLLQSLYYGCFNEVNE